MTRSTGAARGAKSLRTLSQPLGRPEADIPTDAPNGDPEPVSVAPARRWELFFAARPALAPEMRLRTRTGKPKKSLPRLPPNINERRNLPWWHERNLVAYWRELAKLEARRHQLPYLLDRVRVSAIVYRRALGVADGSGDSERLKPLVDGLVSYGLVADDRRRFVEQGPVEERRAGYRGPGILLVIEEVSP